jgi:hypothetical protein
MPHNRRCNTADCHRYSPGAGLGRWDGWRVGLRKPCQIRGRAALPPLRDAAAPRPNLKLAPEIASHCCSSKHLSSFEVAIRFQYSSCNSFLACYWNHHIKCN